jgi:phage FluMu protein Com
MSHSGKCPHCNKTVARAVMENITIGGSETHSAKGVSYLCPHCHAVLSLSIDPLALNTELVRHIVRVLRRA